MANGGAVRTGLCVMALVVSSCGGSGDVSVDPYEVFLANGGGDAWLSNNGEPMLSREDAQLRASLGSDGDWAPKTIDWYLQEAYG